MASLLAQLAKGMIFAHKNFSELQKKMSIRKFSSRRRPSHMCKCNSNIFLLMLNCVRLKSDDTGKVNFKKLFLG